MTWCSPILSPPRRAVKPIAPAGRGPVMPSRPRCATSSSATPRAAAAARPRLRAVAGDDAKPADPGELAEVLADRAAARPGDAAGQRAALGRDDVGDQHAAHPAAAPDNPDSGLGHACLPR